MSFVGAGGTGGYGGAGGSGGGGGRDDKLKKKFDDTAPFAAAGDDEDEPIFPDIGLPDEDAGATAAENRPSGSSAAAHGSTVVEYRGVRRYTAGDNSYGTTYVSCINNRDSPHNNRQIWLGRYFEVRAAAMAYDVFSFFNHNETYVNFPELLHLYAQVVPRRAIQTDGSFAPITAADLERIKHIGLGVIRAFYPNSCAAIHTRRNQKALPAANPALTAQQRQNAASLQAAYHTQIEERTRNHVLGFIANQQPLALQSAGQAGPSSAQASASIPNPTNFPLLAPNLDFSSIQVPSNVSSLQTSHAPTYGSHIDFSAIQVPHTHASTRPLATSTSGPRVGEVRYAPTSPDTLRHATSQQTGSFHSSLFAQDPFAQFAPPSHITRPEAYGSSSEIAATSQTAGHVSRPAPARLVSTQDLSLLRAMGLIRDAPTSVPPQERPNPLIRSNIDWGGYKEEGGGSKGVLSGNDPYREAAEARLYAERLRAERLNREAASTGVPGASSFPLLQRLSELSRAPLQSMDVPRLGSPKKQRSSEPILGAHADLSSSLLRPGHGLQSRSSAFTSYKATDNVQGGSSSHIPSVPEVIPLRPHLPGDHARPGEDQRVVPLSRQTPEELPFLTAFKQAGATAETATNAAAPSTVPSTTNVEASSSIFVRLPEQQGTTSNKPISTELTLARGQLGEPPFVRAPLVPDLNIRAPSEESSEALKGVSTASVDQSPQDIIAPIDIRELQRLSTLGPSWQDEGPSRQQQEQVPYLIQQDKSKQEEDKGKGKEKAED